MRKVYIDPPSKAFYQNRFFEDAELNRDNCLLPYINLKEALNKQGVDVNTFDLWNGKDPMDYYSFGVLDNLDTMYRHPEVNMKAFYVFEPPVVDPSIYKALPKLTVMFDEVYVHNTHGDGYSLDGVEQSKLRKLYWPQPFNQVLEPYWSRADRKHNIVVINGNHKPVSRYHELYSKRIEAMVALSKYDMVDLYGRGWERWCSRASMWSPYWKNRKALMSIYKGPCDSKFEVLSQYKFCLCFENMNMDGYMTEKLFDCLYVGVIPLYWGAHDVGRWVPEKAYIDVSLFSGWGEIEEYIRSLSQSEIDVVKRAGREFIESKQMSVFTQPLIRNFV